MKPDKLNEPIPFKSWKDDTQRHESGVPIKSLENLMLYLENVPKLADNIRWNEMTGAVEWNQEGLSDSDIYRIRMLLEGEGFQPAVSDVHGAVTLHAKSNAYHPIKDYLNAVEWDGKKRLDHWIPNYLGSEKREIYRTFGPKFLIGAVARIFEPGCQMDTMLVLEGKQGVGKTTAVSALFGHQYMNSSIYDFKGKDAAIGLQGYWAIEIAELAALRRTHNDDMKKFITETADRYRPVHGKETVEKPRQCIFIGTTNSDSYLSDATGGRRYWPVMCGNVDRSAIVRDKDQLWAEAMKRFRDGEPWWIEGNNEAELAAAEQADRCEGDPWAGLFEKWLDESDLKARVAGKEPIGLISAVDFLSDVVKVSPGDQNHSNRIRATSVLKSFGWELIRRRTQAGGNPIRMWKRPDARITDH